MNVVKRTAEYTIYQKRSSRYAVKSADSKYINGDDKARILLEHDLIKVELPKPAEPEPEATAEAEAEAAPEAAGDGEEEAPAAE